MSRPERALIDTSFFIALFNERDQYHAAACELADLLDDLQIILPWPILYETVNTRLVRQRAKLARFTAITRLPGTTLLDDSPYRSRSLATVLSQGRAEGSLSLVDSVLCNIIEDINVPVSVMLTFNDRDFLVVCNVNNVELLN